MNRRSFLEQVLAGVGGVATTARLGIGAEGSGSQRIKIGQIGTGHSHAGGKMDAIRKLADVYEVVGVAEADDEQWRRVAESKTFSGLPRLDESELLSTPGLQAVAIETRMTDAIAAASRAIAAGKHIHLDKPGALRHDEFRTMRLEAERRGLTVQMGYMLRYNPAVELLVRAAREGWFGEILEIDCEIGKLANDASRHELAALPGGGMFELACHLIDVVVTVLGKPERVEAFSTPTRSGAGEMQDNQLAVFQYPRATATVRCNHADPFGGPRRRFSINGTRGTMEIRPLESGQFRLMLSDPHDAYVKGEQSVKLDVPGGRYDGEFIDLARVVRGEKKLAWDAAHDIAVHETVLRAAGVNLS